MMMAHDSTPHRPEIIGSTIEALRRALTSYLADRRDAATLQAALGQIAVEARARKLRAEELLILLKDVWFELPEVARASDAEEQNRLLQRIVTLCIREYYTD